MTNFLAPRKKMSYIIIPKISIHLLKHFHFFRFVSKQFTDIVSLNIQMPITFAKSFNVLNDAALTVLQTKILVA